MRRFRQAIPGLACLALAYLLLAGHTGCGRRPVAHRSPTVNCTTDRPVITIGESTHILVRASDPDGDALSYSWAASAGEIRGTGPTVEYKGTKPGEQTIEARVSDGTGGTASCSLMVRVLAPASANGGHDEEIPQFPWPPPQWSARYEVPTHLVSTSTEDTLGTIFDRIKQAVAAAEIQEWSVYAVGADGLAVVMRLECIDNDGRSKSGQERWCTQDHPRQRKAFSIREYVTALFSPNTQRYRVIVLLVTTRPLVGGTPPPTAEEARSLVRSGADTLPAAMRTRVPPPARRVVALVYEFFRQSADDPVQLVENSAITPVSHLVGAKLWSQEALQP